MDTYSVLDALKQTKMGKLSYCRDFDIRDFERLSLYSTSAAAATENETPANDAVGNAEEGVDGRPPKVEVVDTNEAGIAKDSISAKSAVDAEVRDSSQSTTTTETTTTPLKSVLQRPKSSPSIGGTPASSSLSSSSPHSSTTAKSASEMKPRHPSKVTFQVETPGKTTTTTTTTMTTTTTTTTSSSSTTSPAPSPLPSSPSTPCSSMDSPGVVSSSSIHSPRSPISISKQEWDTLKALTDYEIQMEEKTRLNIHRLQVKMSEASKLHQLRAEEEYERKKKDLETRQEKQYHDLQSKSFASMQETRRTIQEKLATDAKHKDDLQAKLRETELHKQEYDRKKAKEKRDLLNSLVSLETQMESMEEEILDSLRRCRFPQLLSEGSKMDNVKNLLDTMRKYLTGQNAAVREGMSAEGGGGGQQQMGKCLSQSIEVVETVKKVKTTVEEEIRRVDVEGERKESEEKLRKEEEEEKRKQEEEEAKKREAEEESRKAAAAAAAAAEQERKAAAAADGAAGEAVSGFHVLTQRKLTEFESVYATLATDKEAATKKVKFELQKAVNTLVNSLANDPTEHRHRGVNSSCSCPSIQTVGRLKKLIDLHCGRRIDSGSGKWVSVADHPQGLAFVSDLTAKKIVKQGSDVVASNKEHAYPVAAVSVALWIQNPAFGKLLLARFHEICVFTVPHYPQRRPDQSQSDYFKSLGYLMDGDKAENQDDFLTRMSGIVRLFATICLTQPPPKGLFGNKDFDDAHPFGLPAAWNWLISHLRLEPMADVSATILYEFLVVLGNALLKTYTKQFTKVVVALIKTYLPRIEAVTLEGRLGPVMRLKEFLETSIRCGGVEPPKGQLPDYFWTPAEQTHRDQY